MLGQLNQIPGVQGSYANQPGDQVLVALLPGVNADLIAAEVDRILNDNLGQRIPERLRSKRAAAAAGGGSFLAGEGWRDQNRVAQDAANEDRAALQRTSSMVGVLLLGCVALGLGFVWWRRRRMAARAALAPTLSPAGAV